MGITKTVLTLAAALLAGTATAEEAAPPLPEPDRRAIEQALGPGVLGAAVADAPALTEPAALLAPGAGTRVFRVSAGHAAPKEEAHRIEPGNAAGAGQVWDYRVGDLEILRLGTQADGSIALLGVEDRGAGVATRYDPPKPLLVRGAAAGQTVAAHLGVGVFDPRKPDTLKHTGAMDARATYLGTFRVRVPAGQYDAALVRAEAVGKIGPAKIDTRQYLFFAPGAGLVASVETREVAALGLYRSSAKAAKMLVSRSR